ncbi:TIGR00730 family Rossman fold protein [Corynebacterium aquilae]|uniref:N-acetyltransferase domain-containing protein n=1 Tax=Corynebacterium aquilae DSM 44791 TaxID=1431546 RepID=A0A1L7CD64_9CORY|nr:TIGR00730 family Rossman fold protein [Corynebacterium aquilae]APT83778.1 hypothetical protein CAQU_00255 [Corynebacterium aquilae DSM 44791]
MTPEFRPMTSADSDIRVEAITRNLEEHSLPLSEQEAKSLTGFHPQRGDFGFVAICGPECRKNADDDTEEGVAGVAWVTYSRDNSLPDVVTSVSPKHQGQGVGTALIDKVLTTARENNLPGLILPVYENHPARRVYARMGFESRAGAEDMVIHLRKPLHRVAVYCGSAKGARGDYVDAAQDLGRELAERGIELVYGGGNVGLMGALGTSIIEAGGTATGVMPQQLVDKEMAHPDLTTLEIVDTMAERKTRMEDLADGFIVLPGGIGTLEELFQVFTGQQLDHHQSPIAFLNVSGFYDPLVKCLYRMGEEGFIQDKYLKSLIVADSVADLFAQLENWRAPGPKWADAVS